MPSALPHFDSLPAAAGLSNAEAFQLSIRHALSLLPTMLARMDKHTDGRETFERFEIL